ncbi:MAG: PadR family transcriptional regulator [Acidobacteriia bacterium]|nr:PadR family transcriptional regulator [Terriglobia bacterium]
MNGNDLFLGLIRLHILYHTVHEPIFGLGIIKELARHGYSLNPGTLYPLLHNMEQKGYLRSSVKRSCMASTTPLSDVVCSADRDRNHNRGDVRQPDHQQYRRVGAGEARCHHGKSGGGVRESGARRSRRSPRHG